MEPLIADHTLVASSFSDPDSEDTHQASQWQISSVSGDYSSPVVDSGTDTINLVSYSVSGSLLAASTTYYWHVRYQDNHSTWSSWSSEGTFTTSASSSGSDDNGSSDTGSTGSSGEDVVSPNCPENLSAQAGDRQVVLSWSPASTHSSDDYRVYRSTQSGEKGSEIAQVTNSTSYTDIGLTNETTYYYTVVSYLSGVGESSNCSQISVTPTGVPPCPSQITISASGAQVTINWTNPTVSDFDHTLIYRSSVSGKQGNLIYTSFNENITSYTDTVTARASYYYTVLAVDVEGNISSGCSQSATTVVTECPARLKALRLKDKSTFLTWSATDFVFSYNLYDRTDDKDISLLASLTSDQTYYFDATKINQDREYQLKVLFSGETEETECSTVKVLAQPPDSCPDLPDIKFNPISLTVENMTEQGPRGIYVKERKVLSIDVSWQLPDFPLKQIYLYREGLGVTVLDPSATSYIDTRITGESAYYKIWADYDLSKYGDLEDCSIPVASQTIDLGLTELCFNLTSPQSNEAWLAESSHEIAWTQPEKDSRAFAFGDNFDILLSSDAGKNFNYVLAKDIVFDELKTSYAYLWQKVDNQYIDHQVQVKVVLSDSQDNQICSASQNFKIERKGGVIGTLARVTSFPAVILAGGTLTLSAGLTGAVNAMASVLTAGNSSLLGQVFYFFQTAPARLGVFLGGWRRRRRKNWGTIYSQTSRRSLARALVQLHKQQFGKVIKSTMSDQKGRFWFLISSPGDYFISVQKPGFKEFISQRFAVDDVNRLPINQEIYLKPAIFEERISLIGLVGILLRVFNLLDRFRVPLLLLGSVASIVNIIVSPGILQYLIIIFYIFLWALEVILYLAPRPYGLIVADGKEVPMAIVRAVKVNQTRPFKTYVTDRQGRFHFLLARGDYRFKVTKLGFASFISSVYRLKGVGTHPNFKFQLKKSQAKIS